MNFKAFTSSKILHSLPAILVYVLVYSRSLTFQYIEGDDATSLAYHLLGRNPALQQPYSIYQGMMDALLGLLPPVEYLLRYTAFGLSSLACVVFFLLIMELVSEWHPVEGQWKMVLPVLVLLAAPEILYMGLSFIPTLLAMCFLLGAHLVFRRCITTPDQKWKLVISALLFGIGVAFRWNTVVYGAVIAVDGWLLTNPAERKKNIARILRWGGMSVLAALIAIGLSNLRTLDLASAVARVASVWSQVGTETSGGLLSLVLIMSPLLTPAMVLLAGVGLVVLIRRKNPLWMVVLVGLAGVLPWLQTGTPKNLITFIPGLLLCFSVGLSFLWDLGKSKQTTRIIRAGLVLLLALPWLLGLQVEKGDTAWGPGFEQKPYDRPAAEGLRGHVVAGTGSAFPTPEGPRPIYGYLDNLVLGQFRAFIQHLAEERLAVLDYARSEDFPVLVTNWSPDYYLADLYASGYRTTDGANHPSGFSADVVYRHFSAGGKAPIDLYYQEMIDTSPTELINELVKMRAIGNRIVLTGYSGTLRTLYLACPQALTAVGDTSALVDLDALTGSGCGAQ